MDSFRGSVPPIFISFYLEKESTDITATVNMSTSDQPATALEQLQEPQSLARTVDSPRSAYSEPDEYAFAEALVQRIESKQIQPEEGLDSSTTRVQADAQRSDYRSSSLKWKRQPSHQWLITSGVGGASTPFESRKAIQVTLNPEVYQLLCPKLMIQLISESLEIPLQSGKVTVQERRLSFQSPSRRQGALTQPLLLRQLAQQRRILWQLNKVVRTPPCSKWRNRLWRRNLKLLSGPRRPKRANGYPSAESPCAKNFSVRLGGTRLFISGPADPLHNLYMVWCHYCKKNISIERRAPSKSPIEAPRTRSKVAIKTT